jgi:cell shape-determining protein MreC
MNEIKIKSNKGVKAGTKRGAYKKKTFLPDSEIAKENEALKAEIARLNAKLFDYDQLSKDYIALNSKGSIVNAPAFIFDPVEHKVFADMNRVIAFGVKSGNLDKRSPNLPQKFTASAIKYYLKNEFNHILK